MRWFALLFVLFLGCFHRPLDVPSLASHAASVEILVGDSWEAIGTAVALEHNGVDYIVSANHVMLASAFVPTRICSIQSACVTLPPNRMIGPLTIDGPADDWSYLVVGSLPRGLEAVQQIAVAEVGDEIYIVGCPLGECFETTQGIITRDGEYYHTDARAMPGNSGGPVFNDQGHLIGVLTAGVEYEGHVIENWTVVTPLPDQFRN